MARGNEITQLMQIVKHLLTKIEETDKKMELMEAAIQNITQEPPRDDGGTNNHGEREEEGGRKKGRRSHKGHFSN